MNVKEIVAEYLKRNRFDGLCCKNCGCLLDDLMLCDGLDTSISGPDQCVPGYLVKATKKDADNLDCNVGDKIIKDKK